MKLTGREKEISFYLKKGYDIKEISKILKLEISTTRTYAKTLYKKLKVKQKDLIKQYISKLEKYIKEKING